MGLSQQQRDTLSQFGQRLIHPVALGMYALIGVGLIFLAWTIGISLQGVDVWQSEAVLTALVTAAVVCTVASAAQHRAIWLAVIVVLLASYLLGYAEYQSLQLRLGQLHDDVAGQAVDVH